MPKSLDFPAEHMILSIPVQSKHALYQFSVKWFCKVYPAIATWRRVWIYFSALEIVVYCFMSCPSSQIAMSGPGLSRTRGIRLSKHYQLI